MKAGTFYEGVFRLAIGVIEESNATKKMESFMTKITDACDSTMLRKKVKNHHWWNVLVD